MMRLRRNTKGAGHLGIEGCLNRFESLSSEWCYNLVGMGDAVEKTVTVDFDLPFPVHISNRPLDVDVKGIKCALRFDKLQREHIDPRLGLGGGNFDLLEDRFGWVRYSKANVSMPLSQLPPVPLGVKKGEWPIHIAISAVNDFLAHYKDLMNLPWIRQMSPTEVWTADVNYIEKGLPTRTVSYKRMHQICPPIVGIEDKREQILRSRLQQAQRASHWKLFLLDAKESLNREDSRLAVVLGQIAIEGAVCEALIYKFLESHPSVKDVRTGLKLKKNVLSYEEALEKASLIGKLAGGLNLAFGDSIEKDITLMYECDVANATRNACVHRGYSPSLKEATKVVRTYWRVYREYLEKWLPSHEAVAVDYVSNSINAVDQAFGRPPSKSLYNVIQETIPILQKRLVFYHIRSLPVHLDRKSLLGQAEDRDDSLAIWLNPAKDFEDNQIFIAETLIYFELKSKGYPYSKVADSLPFEEGRTGWDAVSETLTQVVLGLPINDRLREAGFPVNRKAKRSFEATRARLSASDYSEPESNEARARTTPLEVMQLYFSLEVDEEKQELLDLAEKKLPNYIEDIRCLLEAVQQHGHGNSEECVRLMVKCRNCLLMLDSCLVVDPKRRLVYYSSGPKSY